MPSLMATSALAHALRSDQKFWSTSATALAETSAVAKVATIATMQPTKRNNLVVWYYYRLKNHHNHTRTHYILSKFQTT